MEFKSPLTQRIIISFVVLTTVVSGLFSFGLMKAIDIVEKDLVTAELNRRFPEFMGEYKQGEQPNMDLGTQFYSGTEDIPYFLRGLDLEPGFHEVESEESSFHVMIKKEKERPFFLVQEQTAVEQHENLLELTVIGGFFLSIAASLILGIMMVRRIIAPVQRLTQQVHNREQLLVDAPPLSTGYTDDEVGRLAQAFDRTLGMLQESLLRESLFTSDVSHELRTPLMVIKSSCDLLIAKNQLDDFTRQRIGIISKAANEIQELVDAFLTLARGKETEQEKATLWNIIERNRSEWQQQAQTKRIRLVIRDTTDTASTPAELFPAAMLRTVLNNLIRNALHYTAEGEVILVARDSGFTICDTGPGISTSDKASIFKPFYRGQSGDRNGLGLGLGLSLVQRICARENWTIDVRDNQPSGCCFSIDFKK
ncbi:MAG: HAMP domain-containing sensor histidine kinase [Desulfuromonadales bacterium]|jgi:signal transduction histidine kinase